MRGRGTAYVGCDLPLEFTDSWRSLQSFLSPFSFGFYRALYRRLIDTETHASVVSFDTDILAYEQIGIGALTPFDRDSKALLSRELVLCSCSCFERSLL